MGKVKSSDFNGPKKNRSTYFVFGDEVRTKVMADMRAKHGAAFKISMVASEIGAMWKNVSEEDKKRYDVISKEEKAKYELAQTAWKKTDDYLQFTRADANGKQKKANKENTKKAKESGMPSKPLAPYLRYSMSIAAGVIEQLKKEGKPIDMKSRSAVIKQKFEALSEAEKKELETQYAADKAKYATDIVAWNATEAGQEFIASKGKNAAKARKVKAEAKKANKSPRAMKKRKLEDGSAEPQPEESPESPEDSPAESEESPADSDASPEDSDLAA